MTLRPGDATLPAIMPQTAADIIAALVADFGYDEVIKALMEESKTAPDDQLAAVEALIDAVMVALLADAKGGEELRRAILQ